MAGEILHVTGHEEQNVKKRYGSKQEFLMVGCLRKLQTRRKDSRVVVWIRGFLLGRMQGVRLGGHLSEEVRVNSGVPQGGVLGPLLFLAYVNDSSKNIESTIRLFVEDCVIYRKIINKEDTEKLQKVLDRLGEWAVENTMKINPSKSKAVRFTRDTVKDPLDYSLANTLIPEATTCKYLGIILHSDLSWADKSTTRRKMRGRHYISQCEYSKRERVILKFSLHVTSTSDS